LRHVTPKRTNGQSEPNITRQHINKYDVQQRGKGEYSLATQKSNGEDHDQTAKPKTQNLNNPEPNKETGNGEL
jgi:hypothetical protein